MSRNDEKLGRDASFLNLYITQYSYWDKILFLLLLLFFHLIQKINMLTNNK